MSALMDHLHIRARPPNVNADSYAARLNIDAGKTARQMLFIIFDEESIADFTPYACARSVMTFLQASSNE